MYVLYTHIIWTQDGVTNNALPYTDRPRLSGKFGVRIMKRTQEMVAEAAMKWVRIVRCVDLNSTD